MVRLKFRPPDMAICHWLLHLCAILLLTHLFRRYYPKTPATWYRLVELADLSDMVRWRCRIRLEPEWPNYRTDVGHCSHLRQEFVSRASLGMPSFEPECLFIIGFDARYLSPSYLGSRVKVNKHSLKRLVRGTPRLARMKRNLQFPKAMHPWRREIASNYHETQLADFSFHIECRRSNFYLSRPLLPSRFVSRSLRLPRMT